MSNYPAGAKDDPRAPYNEDLTEEREFYANIIISLPVKIDALPRVNDSVLIEQIKADISKELLKLNETINIDNITIIKE